MQSTLTINTKTETPTISGRELHKALNIETPYSKWFQRMCEYGFTEGVDYTVLDGQKCPTNNPKNPWTVVTDHTVSIPMAKEIAMIQRTPKGKEIRQYLIKVEEDWNSPAKVMARALKIADEEINSLRIQAEQDKPLVEFAKHIGTSKNASSIGDFAKALAKDGLNIGQNRLFAWLRDNKHINARNMPNQRYIDAGYFNVIEQVYMADGAAMTSYKTLVTGKGQVYLTRKLLGLGAAK